MLTAVSFCTTCSQYFGTNLFLGRLRGPNATDEDRHLGGMAPPSVIFSLYYFSLVYFVFYTFLSKLLLQTLPSDPKSIIALYYPLCQRTLMMVTGTSNGPPEALGNSSYLSMDFTFYASSSRRRKSIEVEIVIEEDCSYLHLL